MNERFASLLVFLVLTGCPSHSPSAVAPSSVPPLDTPRAILEVDARDPNVQSALSDIALSTTRTTTLRYLALRKLEEVHSREAITVGQSLALEVQTSTDAAFLRNNAVGVLFRAKRTPEGGQALDYVKHTSVQAAAVAAQLERSGS